jgi:hypothetical protein
MTSKLTTGIYRGRPFGGVAFLWRKSISNFIRVVSSDPEGRSLCIELSANNGHVIRLITVYFPCFSPGIEYTNELGRCLGCIENNLSSGVDTIVLGDMNFTCSDNHIGFKQCCDVFNNFDILNCDDLCVSGDKVTYYNASLGHSSFIDHFFVTTSLRQFLQSLFIVDTGANLSDHRPLVGCFDLSSVLFTNSSDTVHIVSKQASHCAWRWDKSDVSQYYEASRIYLSDVGYNHLHVLAVTRYVIILNTCTLSTCIMMALSELCIRQQQLLLCV